MKTKTIKKLFAAAVALCLSLVMLTACGSKTCEQSGCSEAAVENSNFCEVHKAINDVGNVIGAIGDLFGF
jgi:ABC-type oligopeptide transport system substrate-binding subunit